MSQSQCQSRAAMPVRIYEQSCVKYHYKGVQTYESTPPAQDPMGNKISPGVLEDPGNARANIPNASYPPDTPGFYSNVFLVHNASGGWHPVIDLKQLNAHIYTPDFRMHTVSSVLSTVKRGDSHSK